MIESLIYALESPLDGRVYYVGRSSKGLDRPYSHIKHTHSSELRDWLLSFDQEPVVRILERNVEDLGDREKYWINEMLRRGEPLFNKIIYPERQLKYADYTIGAFVKMKRRESNLSQIEFAEKSGLGLRFVRDLEQGKESCRVDKVLQALQMFGATLVPFIK